MLSNSSSLVRLLLQLHSQLPVPQPGRLRTANTTGPITFGEIGYQLLNQTPVYLTINE